MELSLYAAKASPIPAASDMDLPTYSADLPFETDNFEDNEFQITYKNRTLFSFMPPRVMQHQ